MQTAQRGNTALAGNLRVQVLHETATQQRDRTNPQQRQGRQASRRKRVAAYCRVSTDHEDQEASFEAQQAHFSGLIAANPTWQLAHIYADEESGTQTRRRESFMQMIADCEAGQIDLVLTKSISRFARNTLDCLQYIRRLKALQIPIVFTKEGINTMDAGGEVLVTIMASIAQQESASISQNVQLGVRYRYQEGKVCSGVYRLLGYERTSEGSLAIVPREAAIVRRIFREYLDGFSPKHIAERLRAEGVDGSKVTATGIVVGRSWNYQGIEYLLRNEKYAGDLLLQKYYTVDFLEKRTALNTGQLPQYLVRNNHEPIVPREVFAQVQEEMMRRHRDWRSFRQSHAHALAGRLVCGCCRAPFRGRLQRGTVWWTCEAQTKRKQYPGVACASAPICQDALQVAVAEAFAQLPQQRDVLERMRTQVLGNLSAGANDAGSAALADQLWQIDGLLDRIAVMRRQAQVWPDRQGACWDKETFRMLTRPPYEGGGYSEDDTYRFVRRVVRTSDGLKVYFKAGISIGVNVMAD